MLPLTAADLLNIWERGVALDTVGRMRVLLGAAAPDRTEEELGEFTAGRRDTALLALREAIFGPHAMAIAPCPGCGEVVEFSFSVAEVRPHTGDPASVTPVAGPSPVLQISVDGLSVSFRLPTLADIEAVTRTGPDGGHVGRGAGQDARACLLRRCVTQASRGEQAVAAEALSEQCVAAVEEAMARADPGADIRFALNCEACGERWSTPLDVHIFVWSEVDACARRLLAEVDALASAYGWSEEEIVSLAPARRQAYLELAGAAEGNTG